MGGLWRNNERTPEGKYLVVRRDGSVPAWPWFVMGARDPAAPAALVAYAAQCERLGFDADYVSDLRRLAAEFERYASDYGHGRPDAPPDRIDDAATVAKMPSATGGLRQLLAAARAIWGENKLSLQQIVIRLGVGVGDLCRMARGADKDQYDDIDLQKELGNIIFSVIRWCDDLGYDPVACVSIAMDAQRRFAQENRRR